MHHCLLISEILLKILEYCDQLWEDTRVPTLSAMSLTCRFFSEPSLDFLWCKQTSLIPLMLCLPDDLLSRRRQSSSNRYDDYSVVLALKRRPTPMDWGRFITHARRIKELEWDSGQDDYQYVLHAKFFQAILKYCPQRPLLPNLRRLECSSEFPLDGNYTISLKLLTSSLREFWIDLLPTISQNELSTIMKTTTERCPHLRTIFFGFDGPSHFDTATFTTSIGTLRNLRSLCMIFGSADHKILALPPMIREAYFPSLNTLELTVGSLTSSLPLMESIGPSRLRKLTFNFRRHFSVPSIQRFFQAMNSNTTWLLSLRILTLGTLGDSLNAIIPPSTFELLFSFQKLRIMRLRGLRITLDDEFMGKIACAWPELEEFGLHNIGLSSISLNSIKEFSERCPNISFLQLSVNATDVPPIQPSPPSRRTPGLLMRMVFTAESEITDPPAVASFLLSLFPRLDVKYMGSREDEFSEYWDQVNEIVSLAMGHEASLMFPSYHYW